MTDGSCSEVPLKMRIESSYDAHGEKKHNDVAVKCL